MNFLGLNWGIRNEQAPLYNGICIQQPRPKAWKFGKNAIKEYSDLNNSGTKYLAPNAWALKLRFESKIPLGLPVVPPEYIIPSNNLLKLADMILATFGDFINRANN